MKSIVVVSFMLVCSCFPLLAQEAKLKGTVISTEKPPPKLWGGVRIKVKNRANNQDIAGEQKVTSDQGWYHIAPLGAIVDILFDKDCYVPDGIYNVNVSPGESLQDTVQLQRARECLIADRRRDRTRDKRNAAVRANIEISGLGVTIRGSVEASASGFEPAVDNRTALDRDLFPSAPTLTRQLEKEAEIARIGGFQDTFQYNFGVKQRMYGEDAELMNVLSSFKSDAKNADLFKEISEITPAMLDDVIRAQFEMSGEVNLDYIKKVVKADGLGPSLRGSATVALLNLKLDENTRNELTEYFRAQNENSPISNTALVARARLGDKTLYDDLRSSNNQARTLLLIEVISAARIADDRADLSQGSQILAEVASRNTDPVIRQAAFSALRAFAFRSDRTAIDALLAGVRTDPQPAVRFWAAVSLGVGNLEERASVRRVLRFVASQDSSADVRRAANFSLSGARWMHPRY